MAYLIAALVATAAGPLLYDVLHERPRLTSVVDGFVYAAVPVLVAWQILSLARDRRSVLPVLLVGVGFLLPLLVGRASQSLRRRTDVVTLLAGLSGLLLHTLFDGAALAPLAPPQSTAALKLAVILHRLLEGLVVWWILRPGRGVAAAVAGVGAVLLTTTFGFALGRELLGGDAVSGGTLASVYQALVAGSLLHVIFHQGRHAHTHAHGHSP